MTLNRNWPWLALLLALLTAALAGCASSSPPSVVAPPLIPPLPATARVSAVAVRCSPTCSDRRGTLQQEQAQRLMSFESQELPASAPTGP